MLRASFLGEGVAIIDDFEGIAKRLRELKLGAPKDAHEIAELERWRDHAMETARVYVENRRRDAKGSPPPRKPFRS
jgi:hypothetical protein